MTAPQSPQLEAKMASQFQVTNPYHSQGLAAGGSALLDAINKGKIHLAKFILDAGEADVVNTRDFKGKTPLIRACYIKEEKTRNLCVGLLISRGADVNKQDDAGRTVLSYACETRCNDIVRLLVKNNIDPDIPDNKGNTALIYSAMIGNDTAVAILVRSFRRLGLNVDHMNSEGMTALLIAAKNGFIECASILALEGRACISFRDKEHGYNAEEWARAHGCSTKQILTLSPSVALLQHRAGSRRAEESVLLSPGGARHFQGRRSFQFPAPKADDASLLIEDVDELSLSGGVGSNKLLQKRGSLPSVTSFTGVTSVRSNSSCTSRCSSALGIISHRSPSLTTNRSKTSVASRFNTRHEHYTSVATQTDIIQNVAFNTSPDRPKSADPCGAQARYGMSALGEFGQAGTFSYLEQPLLCAACHAELEELRVRSPRASIESSTTRTSTRSAKNIKVDFSHDDGGGSNGSDYCGDGFSP